MGKKVEVKESVRGSHVPFSDDTVVHVWDSEGNEGKGVGKTEDAARANAQAAYNTATKDKGK